MKGTRSHTAALRTAMLLFFATAFASRCARVMTPEGGPKDTLPPVIVSLTPDNFSTNFNEKRIIIEFDEYVQIKDQQKEFFTSPQMKKKPTISLRGRGIMVQIKDTLLENQTYALDFGSAIRDNNEGNPLHGMRYVFSTGEAVDSMTCTGYTADAYRADSVEKTFIYFYYADSLPVTPEYDSTIFNRKPDAIARAQSNGIFIAQNLKPVKYRAIAVKDTNDNQMYDPGTDMVGFIDSMINPAELPDYYMWYDSIRRYVTAEPQLYFRMFTDKAFRRHTLQMSERPARNRAMLYFGAENPDIKSIRFDSIADENFIIDYRNRGRDTVALWFAGTELPDTIRGEITFIRHDSINNLVEATEPLRLTWRFVETKEQQREREKNERAREKAEAAGEEWVEPKQPNPFGMKIEQRGDINPLRTVDITFDYPIQSIDSAAVVLNRIEGSEPVESVPVRFERDTSDILKWHMKVDWQPATKYALTLPEGVFTDIAGQQNDSLSVNYTTHDPDKFGKVTVRLSGGRNGASYIVQLLNGAGRLTEERRGLRGGDVETFEYVQTGEIKLRIIEDMNHNGEWDSGNLVEMRQPERSEMYSADEQETFQIKANWESDIDIDLDALFAPVTMHSLQEMLDAREVVRLKKYLEDESKRRKDKDKDHNHSSGGFGMPSLGSGGLSNFGNMF